MRPLRTLLAVLPLSTTIGCANHFMPMEDYSVAFDFLMASDVEEARYRAYICMPDGSVCGRRRMDSEDYDPDYFAIDYGGEELEDAFQPSGAGNEWIEAGNFPGEGAKAGPDAFQGFWMNDLPFVPMDVPPTFQVSAPALHEELNRSSMNKVRVEWTPSNQGFPMQWKLFPVDNEIELKPCDMLAWGSFKGEGEDTGFVDIPMDIFPSDLPPDGCEVAVRLLRIKSFDLPEGVKNGYIHSIMVDGVIFRMMP